MDDRPGALSHRMARAIALVAFVTLLLLTGWHHYRDHAWSGVVLAALLALFLASGYGVERWLRRSTDRP